MTVALVLGGGDCVWDDVNAALEVGEFDGVVACNDAGAAWPGRLDGWVSLHSDRFAIWSRRRERARLQPADRLFGHKEAAREGRPAVTYTEFRFPGQENSGSSGLFALKVALIDLGFDRAVLCGVPMSVEHRHFFEDQPWRGAINHRRGWGQAMPQIKDRARSMSGWTKEQLGAPDAAWLTQ